MKFLIACIVLLFNTLTFFSQGNIQHITGSFLTKISTVSRDSISDVYGLLGVHYATFDIKTVEVFAGSALQMAINLAQTETVYLVNAKHQRIELLQKDKISRETEIVQQAKIQHYTIFEIVVIAILLVVIFIIFRKKRIAFLMLSNEIEMHKQTDIELKHSEERFHYAMLGANDGFWDWNLKTDIVYYSLQWAKMLGIDNSSLSPNIEELKRRIHPSDYQSFKSTVLDKISGTTTSFEVSYRFKHSEGRYILVLCRGYFIRKNNRLQRIVGTHMDITAKKQNETELIKHRAKLEDMVKIRTIVLEKAHKKAVDTNKLKSVFLTTISHEVRTPINAIIKFSEILISNDTKNNEREIYYNYVRTNGQLLLKFMDDILAISQIESSEMLITKKKMSINKLLYSIHSEHVKIKAFQKKERIAFLLSIPKFNYIMNTDSLRLRQIIQNLVENAFKFTTIGFVELGYNVVEDNVVFFVKDSGKGIDQQFRDRIFERFYKIENPDFTDFQGVGLGLSISKNLVEMLGGQIRLKSAPQKGSEFSFTLPLDIL